MKQRWKTVYKSLKTLMKPLEITLEVEKDESSDITGHSATVEESKEESNYGLGGLEKRALNDPRYVALRKACLKLLSKADQSERKYYRVNILKQIKVYGDYESFGELALITNKRRKAKIETITDTHFALLSKQDYSRTLLKIQNQKLREQVEFLRKFDLFQSLSDSNLRALSYSMQESQFIRGQEIYREGQDHIDCIYLIKRGELKVTKIIIKDN